MAYKPGGDGEDAEHLGDLNSEFVLGKADYEFDEEVEESSQRRRGQLRKNSMNIIENFDNQTEDSDRLRQNIKNSNGRLSNQHSNNYYEFIIHKLIQYDVRKYPDEIISKNVVVQGKLSVHSLVSHALLV